MRKKEHYHLNEGDCVGIWSRKSVLRDSKIMGKRFDDISSHFDIVHQADRHTGKRTGRQEPRFATASRAKADNKSFNLAVHWVISHNVTSYMSFLSAIKQRTS